MEISNELRRLVDPNSKYCCEYCFSSKCKEWAYLQYGIIIQSYLYNGKWRVDILKGIEIDEFFKNIDSEPEAIFKACQWILEKEIQEENRLQLQEDLSEYNTLIKEGS